VADKKAQKIANNAVKAAGGKRRAPVRGGGVRTPTFSAKKAVKDEKKKQEGQ